MINAQEFWKQVSIGPNLTNFVSKYPEFKDFWEKCERADWMYWLIGMLHDFSDKHEKHKVFYKKHEQFWSLYREIVTRNKLLNEEIKKVEELDFSWISSYIENLRKEIDDEKEVARKSWLGAYTWLQPSLEESVNNATRQVSFKELVLSHLRKTQELGRELNDQEKAELNKINKEAQEKAVIELYKEQANLFRQILGNLFE